MNKIVFIIIMLISISACNTPSIIVSENLKSNTTVMDAKGRQGWQFNQVITYGEYTTSKIKKGWTSGYDYEFIARFRSAEQKLKFNQFSSLNKAEVFAVGKFKTTELDLLDGFLSYPFEYENYFAGTVILTNNNKVWDFIIHDPEGGTVGSFDCGIAKNQNQDEIIIRGVRKVEGQLNWIKLDNFGFEFIMNGQSIGAVSTINNGRVWMKNNIDEDIKLVISSISTSLLVREELQETSFN